MIKKLGLLAVAAVMAVPLAMMIMPSATAAAPPGVRITTIYFNPAGPDYRNNKTLNPNGCGSRISPGHARG